jgi:hypothetical protein
MDDFNINTLRQCTTELCSRLLNVITPFVIEGIQSIYDESCKICVENKEPTKYLMTFQNLLCRIPKWNSVIIKQETDRIIEKSGCGYLEDLVTCVHIIQLKTLTAIRVGNKQKKIDISIPNLEDFIHKVYIHVARKLYVNIYLFEKEVTALQSQRNRREFELIVHECILNAIRESIPTEQIIRAYMDESVEVEEEIIVEDVPIAAAAAAAAATLLSPPSIPSTDATTGGGASAPAPVVRTIDDIPATAIPVIQNVDETPVVTRLSFNDIDSVLNDDGTKSVETAPKNIERLEEISAEKFLQRKMEESAAAEAADSTDKIKVLSDSLSMDDLDIQVL